MRKLIISLVVIILFVPEVFSGNRKSVNPGTALEHYIHNRDRSFQWKVEKFSRGEELSVYHILFTSQHWRGIAWQHELVVLVPVMLEYRDALLFITGGSLKNGEVRMHDQDDETIRAMGQMAVKNKAITSIVWQVPNQPLFGDLKEDALISYTYQNYLQDKDYTWPMLFPMTKSALRAMDVLQKFAKRELKIRLNQFLVSGASKRGWTTWLTGASGDPRVRAIAPMVIDVLNMPVNIDYQKTVWGDYSIEIEDYVKLGIAQKLSTPGGSELVEMVDPYSYRKKLTMPKMISIATNDPYWPVDAVKNYLNGIPGENYLCYVPDAGHNMGDKKQVLKSLSAFFAFTLTNTPYPECQYKIAETGGTIQLDVVPSPDLLLSASLWDAKSEDRDFRNEKWQGKKLEVAGLNLVETRIDYPESGYRAFYVELTYKAPLGNIFTACTRMFVADPHKVFFKEKE